MHQVLTARGRFGATVSFDGYAVTIEKKSRTFAGRGQRSMPLDQIATVVWRHAGWVSDGVLGFTVPGMTAPRPRFGQRTVSALDDPWQVPFRRRQQAAFEALHQAITTAQHGAQQPSGWQWPGPPPQARRRA